LWKKMQLSAEYKTGADWGMFTIIQTS